MKYMVMVNGKYMTQVETDRSACGAEHIILDDIRYGIESALAFDAEAIKTQHFFDCLQSCKMVSLDELKIMSSRVKYEVESKIMNIEEEISEIEHTIKELQAKRKDLGYALNAAKNQNGTRI